MLIAVTDSWPNLIDSAEREFMRRFEQAAARTGHTVVEVTTSDDIHACKPDFVLCMHEFTPKLTPYPTFGVMWSPPEFYRHDAYRIKSIRSYDAYLVGSEHVRHYLDDLEFYSRVKKPKSSFHFLPVAPSRPLDVKSLREQRSLAYVGVHWDGSRHGAVLNELTRSGTITVYGPHLNWSHLQSGYGGPISFDGCSIFDVLSSHGIALCVHKQEHREADTPSMRLFEAAAAGCVIIADEIPYARRMLGDSALYIDLRETPSQVAEAIRSHVQWVAANSERAAAMAHRSQIILNHEYSLENLVVQTCSFAEEVHKVAVDRRVAVKHFTAPKTINTLAATPVSECRRGDSSAAVDIVVRCGGRDLDYVKRAIGSVSAQTAGTFCVILVDYKQRSDLRQFANDAKYDNVCIKYIEAPNNGFRSTSLWLGLSHITAPFFSIMDDDDYVMAEHYCGLLYSATKNPDASFFYCGVVRVEEDGKYMTAPNFNGPGRRTILKSRELKFLDEFHLGRLVAGDNYIQSNAWIARSSLLDKLILEDPELEFAEDMYLYLLLASKTRFVCSNQATAYWSWRSNARDNSMFENQSDTWKRCLDRIHLRLKEVTFPFSVTYMEMLFNQRRLHDLCSALDLTANSAKKKRVGPIKSFLRSIPIYNSYREARRKRKQMRRVLGGR